MFETASLSWFVTIPPIIVLLIALISKNVLYALSGGIISAVILITKGNVIGAALLGLQQIYVESNLPFLVGQGIGSPDHAYTFGFLICLGIIIELITHSGGIEAYAALMDSYIKTGRQAETMPLVVAPLFFLDDYLNNLVGGAIVRPLLDKFSIARAKLSYLLNACSSSQCLLIPASSWLAFIISQFQKSGISSQQSTETIIASEPYSLYLVTIPYLLYPIISIATAWFIVRAGISFGPMAHAENLAHTTHNAKEPSHEHRERKSKQHYLSNFLVPLGSFLILLPLSILRCNGWYPFHPTLSWYHALCNTDFLLQALWHASIAAVLISFLFFLLTRRMNFIKLLDVTLAGFMFMKNSILLLLLAWTFSALLSDHLHTGSYLAQLLITYAPLAIIPVACFITATMITALIGSSWGMLGILLPLLIPFIAALPHTGAGIPTIGDLPLLLPTLGAIFSGAAAGPHISPITDAAIISSTTAGISPLEHIRTIVPYVLPGIFWCSIGFITLALVPRTSYTIIFILLGTLLCTCLSLLILNWLYRRNK